MYVGWLQPMMHTFIHAHCIAGLLIVLLFIYIACCYCIQIRGKKNNNINRPPPTNRIKNRERKRTQICSNISKIRGSRNCFQSALVIQIHHFISKHYPYKLFMAFSFTDILCVCALWRVAFLEIEWKRSWRNINAIFNWPMLH